MNTAVITPPSDTIRRQIVDAARERFRHYGYEKTTMTELARDVGMSAANLYRYFRNKQDIAAACAGQCLRERHAELCKRVLRQGHTAAGRLEALALAALDQTRRCAAEEPHIDAMVDAASHQRTEVLRMGRDAEQALITQILLQGIQSGEFETPDIADTARALHTALVLFRSPRLTAMYPEPELERLARGVVALIIRGLARRSRARIGAPYHPGKR